jgi:hypothetical protein
MSETEISKAAKTLSKLGAAKGGKARFAKLTPEERKAFASKGGRARWDGELPIADYEGEFNIGSAVIACAVLPNGQRIITQAAFLRALGRSRSPKAGTGVLSTVDNLPFFLQAQVLQPFISNELRESTTPIFYKTKTGEKGVGYDALLLPRVAEVYLKLRDHMLQTRGAVPKLHEHIIFAADTLVRGLANVGIIALIDEATGYQEVRDRLALQEILDKFLRKEFAAWAKCFPEEFYKQIFRLRQWEWRGMKVNRPQIVAHYTKDLIYARLAPGILQELEARNPRDEKGRRKAPFYWWLTEDVGHPALAQLLFGVIGLMRAADTWDVFMTMINRSYPRRGDTLQLDLFLDDEFYVTTQGAIATAK